MVQPFACHRPKRLNRVHLRLPVPDQSHHLAPGKATAAPMRVRACHKSDGPPQLLFTANVCLGAPCCRGKKRGPVVIASSTDNRILGMRCRAKTLARCRRGPRAAGFESGTEAFCHCARAAVACVSTAANAASCRLRYPTGGAQELVICVLRRSGWRACSGRQRNRPRARRPPETMRLNGANVL